jgi:hypothetical protein
MSHYCRICGSYRANERFTGRGHRAHVCKDCQKLPSDDRASIEAEDEISDFLFRQTHISERNLARLRLHCGSQDPRVAGMAEAVLAAAVVAPYKRRRFRVLRRSHPHILRQLADAGLLDSRDFEEELGVDEGCATDALGLGHDSDRVVADEFYDLRSPLSRNDDGQDDLPF